MTTSLPFAFSFLFLLFSLFSFFRLFLLLNFVFYECGVLVGVADLPSKGFREERRLNTQPIRRMRRGLRRDGGSDAFIHIYAIYFVFPVYMLDIHPPYFLDVTRIDD